jgi:hypothetical protein
MASKELCLEAASGSVSVGIAPAQVLGLRVSAAGNFPATVLLNRTGELNIPPIIAYLAPLAGIVRFVPAYLYFQHEIQNYQSAGH